MLKLREAMGTPYLLKHHMGKVKELIDSCEEGEIIDIADIVFTNAPASIISSNENKNIEFIDSKDPKRDMLLKMNRERLLLEIDKSEIFKITRASELKDKILAMDTETVYIVDDVSIFVMIQLVRPEVKLQHRSSFREIFRVVSETIYLEKPEMASQKSPYLVTRMATFYEVDTLSSKDKLDLDKKGEYYIPANFGKERLKDTYPWSLVYKKCVGKVIEKYREPLTLDKFLEN